MMRVLPLRPPDPAVVALLKSLLRQAEAGDLVSLIYSAEVTGAAALRQADQVREAHYDADLWTDEVMAIVTSMDTAGSIVTIPDILDRMDIPRAQQNTATQRRVANILKTNGYESAMRRAGGNNRFQRYWRKILSTVYA